MTQMFDDIFEQPEAIRHTARAVAEQLGSFAPIDLRGKVVILTGMGGSFGAMGLPQVMLAERGIPALMIESAELIHHYQALLSDSVVVTASQSGYSVEIVRLLDVLDTLIPRPTVLGVTNAPDSPLAQRSTSLVIQAGTELAVATKTYTCTLAGLILLGHFLTGGNLAEAVEHINYAADAIESSLPAWKERAREVAGQIAGAKFVTCLGRGESRASAMTAALVTKETAKLPTEAMVGGQFRHGPVEALMRDTVTAIFMGEGGERDLNEKLAGDVEGYGYPVIRLGAGVSGTLAFDVPLVSRFTRPLAEIVPIQLLAAELAIARGFVPGQFRYTTKVTTTE